MTVRNSNTLTKYLNNIITITILVAFLTALSIVACGKAKEDEFATNQWESDIQTGKETGSTDCL